ncbi:septum site-determining protein MinD [Photobacterium leiognathi]|uniref:septum site-determining protein MinD n=1 Tax=Photobacterium leiognathi TaxID=553611 RepID=UPI0029822E53|nr:septum site-determining protein MinD [Photobacterium leiognathi]
MSKVICITSGKGGVGKSTSACALAGSLAMSGKKTVLVECDIGTPNLHVLLGCENRVIYSITDLAVEPIEGEKELLSSQALIKVTSSDKSNYDNNLYLLAGSKQIRRDKLTQKELYKVIEKLKNDGFDFIILDSPAGIDDSAHAAMYWADMAIFVVNPEMSSITDADKAIAVIDSSSYRAENPSYGDAVTKHLLVTRYDQQASEIGDQLTCDEIQSILRIDSLLGVIPEANKHLRDASQRGLPVVASSLVNHAVGQQYIDAAQRLLGNNIPLRSNKVSFFQKIFKK